MTRYFVLASLALVLGTAACSKQPAGNAPPPPAAPATGVVAAAPPPPAASQAAPASAPAPTAGSPTAAPPRVVDAAGLTVEFLGDGRVALKGKDQWGGVIDTTYENVKFLQGALPVLTRTVTPPQIEALRKAVGAPAVPAKAAAPAVPAKAGAPAVPAKAAAPAKVKAPTKAAPPAKAAPAQPAP